MITVINNLNEASEYRGLSTDIKPTDDFVENGDVFVEMDTSKVFFYDKKTKRWLELK